MCLNTIVVSYKTLKNGENNIFYRKLSQLFNERDPKRKFTVSKLFSVTLFSRNPVKFRTQTYILCMYCIYHPNQSTSDYST